ncbi:MAG: RluA family pseudouridine synthase [Methylobacteriaceae bacterium]|nr:RluA family pseudouridine synthase [Methylobacteriaceae bacterium]
MKRARPESSTQESPPAPPQATTPVETRIVGEDEDGLRLDRWFKRHYPALALSHLSKLLRKGEIRLDGKRCEGGARLSPGMKVRVPPLRADVAAPAVKTATATPADARALAQMTLFEDRDVIVLNKPWGLAVQGGSGTTRHVDGMLAALENRKGERPLLVHRLDRDTSGVLLVARSRKIAADLGALFRSRRTTKIYWALVLGVPKPAQGRISLFLAKGARMGDDRGAAQSRAARDDAQADQERMRIARHGEPDAQHSLTYYATVDKSPPRLAWLSMKPITGRTHQLRAHAEAIGHPIVGDPKYGRLADNDPRLTDPLRAIPAGIERKLHLLARRLVLPHPRGQGVIDVVAPLPPHMQRSWDMLGFDAASYDPIAEAPDE